MTNARRALAPIILGVLAVLVLATCQLASPAKGITTDAKPRWVTPGVPLDFITGGGWFIIQPYQEGTVPGGRSNFGWHGGVKNGQWWGDGNYIDHAIGLHVHSISVTGYERLGQDGTDAQGHPTGTRAVCGLADTDLYGTVRYLVQMTDNGEPGAQDKFAIVLVNPTTGYIVYGAEGSLGDPT